MRLYVVRHGQTDWNVVSRLQGKNDIPLNEEGIRQAEEVRETLKDYGFDLIFASPLQRAALTARIINADRQKPIFFEERLKERAFGTCEGMVKGTYDYTLLWDYEANESFGGESIRDFFERVGDFLDELKKCFPDKTVLIVCHGGTMRAIECYFNGIKSPEDMAAFFSQNGEIRTYEA